MHARRTLWSSIAYNMLCASSYKNSKENAPPTHTTYPPSTSHLAIFMSWGAFNHCATGTWLEHSNTITCEIHLWTQIPLEISIFRISYPPPHSPHDMDIRDFTVQDWDLWEKCQNFQNRQDSLHSSPLHPTKKCPVDINLKAPSVNAPLDTSFTTRNQT